jgi:predicted NBD/HSP70 family sugar kinase
VIPPLLASIDRVHEGRPHRVKDEEKARLYRAVCMGRSPTRQSLARSLSLRPSSVSDAMQELVDDGLVVESTAPRRGRSGRPRSILAPRGDRFTAISLYVDSRELKAALVTPAEEALVEEARSLPADAGNAEIARAMLGLLGSLSRRVPDGSACVGAGISLVGTVNPRTRAWVSAARWPRLAGLDLSAVGRKAGLPLLIRRANEAELEYYLDGTPGARAGGTLLLHWGFGVGSAMAHQGTLLTSTLGRFGEIGHTRLATGSTARCLCGRTGCVETEAALWALLPRLRGKLGDLPEDEKELAPLLGDPRLLRLPEMRRAMGAIREALLVLCMVFYPDTVLLSGPFTENRAIFRSISDGIQESLPAYARGSIGISALPGGMPGCRRGGANPLFREALARALRRNT